jgi:type I restriction enzyme M protein
VAVSSGGGGRRGIVVPHIVLFVGGVDARIKKQLLTECDLHTIVRLPDGAFAPYTNIATNLLFLQDRSNEGNLDTTRFRHPDARMNYSKTKPMRFEEFADCKA